MRTMTSWSRSEVRAILKYNFARGLSIDQCLEEIKLVLDSDCPHRTTIFRWYREFERGNFNLEDAEREGRPRTSVTEENISAVRKMLDEDRRVTYRQIEETLHLHAPAVQSILKDHLKVKKVCCLWVPHNLTEEQMTHRVAWCRKMLKLFDKGQSQYVNSIVTGDETWLYYYDVPTKAQNKVWVFDDEHTPVAVRKSRSVKKKMIAVFFRSSGIVERVVLDTQKTVTAKWYTEQCLAKVIESLKNLRPKSRMDTWYLHHDNAPAHRARACTEYLATTGLKLLEHPPYSPDLAPCDFALFPHVKMKLKGRRFSSDEDLLRAWDNECASLQDEIWQGWFKDWFRRMERCIECGGNYFEKIK